MNSKLHIGVIDRVSAAFIARRRFKGISLPGLIAAAVRTRQATGTSATKFLAGMVSYEKCVVEGKQDNGWTAASQGVAMINDIPTCQELIERIMTEAEEVLEQARVKMLD